jgi:hypothetical protein
MCIYKYIYIHMYITTYQQKWLGFNFTPDPTMVQGIVVLFVGDIYYMTLRYAMLGCSALHYIATLIYIYIYINIIYITLHYH